jgi:hypothetical protein
MIHAKTVPQPAADKETLAMDKPGLIVAPLTPSPRP